jgi:hypothetical protein
MNMPFVNMGGKDKLVLAAQDFPCKLHPDFMGLFRRGLTRFKRLYQMAAQVRSLVNVVLADSGKFNIGGFDGSGNVIVRG